MDTCSQRDPELEVKSSTVRLLIDVRESRRRPSHGGKMRGPKLTIGQNIATARLEANDQ